MRLTGLMLTVHLVLGATLLALSPSLAELSSKDPFRILSPSGGVLPHPAVLFVPGCSGFADIDGVNFYDDRAAELRAAGYVVVFVDYIGRRMQSNCGHISQAEVVTDILEAATWTRRQTGVVPDKITIIGWSYGGGGVLAALKVMPLDSPITKAVMYYPVCRGAGPWSTAVAGLMLLGAMDDVAYPALCDAVVQGMEPGKLRTMTYPNARHGFDIRRSPERTDHPPGEPGYDPEAAKASWSVVLDFLK